MNFKKHWLNSKTIFFNLAVSAVGVWSLLEGYLINAKALVEPETYGLLLLVVGIAGVALRVVTTTAIAVRKEKP